MELTKHGAGGAVLTAYFDARKPRGPARRPGGSRCLAGQRRPAHPGVTAPPGRDASSAPSRDSPLAPTGKVAAKRGSAELSLLPCPPRPLPPGFTRPALVNLSGRGPRRFSTPPALPRVLGARLAPVNKCVIELISSSTLGFFSDFPPRSQCSAQASLQKDPCSSHSEMGERP